LSQDRHAPAIDRSTKMIEMAAKRNRAAVAAGRADFRAAAWAFGDRLSAVLRRHDFSVEDVAVGPGPMVGARAHPA
jgi:hypothetical protein